MNALWILLGFVLVLVLIVFIIYKYVKSLGSFVNKVYIKTQEQVIVNTPKFKNKKKQIEVTGREVFDAIFERLAKVNWERAIPKLLKYFVPAFITLIVFKTLTSTIISDGLISANTTGQDTQTLTLFLDSMSGIIPLIALIVLFPLIFMVYIVFSDNRF